VSDCVAEALPRAPRATAARILITEDERIIARGIARRLQLLGYDVAGTAATGEAALQQALALGPDLVLMDIHLGGGMDGIEAASAIRIAARIPVVYLTAHADEATLHRGKLAEPYGYVLKPFEDRALTTAIEIALYKHRAEAQLREQEAYLSATLGSLGDGVIATDEDGYVRVLNGVAARLTGWREEDAVGLPVTEVYVTLDARTRQPLANPALAVLTTGRQASLAHTLLVGRDGAEYAIDDRGAPIRGADGALSGAVVIFTDAPYNRRGARPIA
jgi:two-component system, cell cycle sensor histidine kinase and response regulator CckA